MNSLRRGWTFAGIVLSTSLLVAGCTAENNEADVLKRTQGSTPAPGAASSYADYAKQSQQAAGGSYGGEYPGAGKAAKPPAAASTK